MTRPIFFLIGLATIAGCDSVQTAEREILVALDQAHRAYILATTSTEKVKVLDRRIAILDRSKSVGIPKPTFIATELCFAQLRKYVWETARGNYPAARDALVKANEINRNQSLGIFNNIDLTDPTQAVFITESIRTLDDGLVKSFAKNPEGYEPGT